MDRKIVQLREAMQTILSELHRGDYFSIVEFASSVMVRTFSESPTLCLAYTFNIRLLNNLQRYLNPCLNKSLSVVLRKLQIFLYHG